MLLPPSVRFLGKSLSRAPKNSAWNRFEKKTPRGIVLRRLTSWSGRRHNHKKVVWRTFDIDPNVRLLSQGCHSTRLFKTFPSRRQTPENSAK
jgi:hypothetical protein